MAINEINIQKKCYETEAALSDEENELVNKNDEDEFWSYHDVLMKNVNSNNEDE